MAVKEAVSTPAFIPTWATDGGAENVDPGPAKRADGFLTGEAPAAGTMNNQLGAYGGWQAYMVAAVKYMMAATNNDFTEADPWVSPSNTATHFREEANRWYARLVHPGGQLSYQDSADGETWGAAAVMAIGMANAFEGSDPVTDGSQLAVTAFEFFYLSTDLNVANLPAAGAPTSTINVTASYICQNIVWDSVNSLWIAVGASSATNGFIDTSPDGINWTTRLNIADSIIDIATDGSGRTVVSTNNNVTGNGRFYYSTNGTVWTVATGNTTGVAANELFYVEGLAPNGAFLCLDATLNERLWISIDGGDNWDLTVFLPQWVWYNKDFFMFADRATNPLQVMRAIIDISGDAADLNVQTVDIGTRGVGAFNSAGSRVPEREASRTDNFQGSSDKITWAYSADHKMAVARFGPDAT